MGSSGGAPNAPDYSGLISAAQQQQAQYTSTMNDELAFAKKAYNDQLPYTQGIQTIDLQNAQDAQKLAQSQQAQYAKLYQPLAAQFVGQAQDYSDPTKTALARGQAEAAVGQQFDAAGDAAKRSLESFGVDPSATRFAALDIGTRTARAAATAAAGTQSDINRANTGLGLEATALNIGNGLPGQISSGVNSGTAAGGAGVGAGNSTYGTYSGALGNPLPWASLASGALGLQGQLTGQQFNNQNSQFNSNQNASSGFGSALGAGLGIASMFLKKGGAVPDPTDLAPGNPTSRSSISTKGHPMTLPRGLHKLSNVPLSMNFAEGGAIPMAGQQVPPEMSPSGGAQTDDVPAQVSGGALPIGGRPQANINVGEFIFPKDVTNWLGQKALQQQIIKARKDMAGAPAHAEGGPPPQGGAPGPQAPSGDALRMAGGGAVPGVAPSGPAAPRAPLAPRAPAPGQQGAIHPTLHLIAATRPRNIGGTTSVQAAPGPGGGAGKESALPLGRPRMPAPYPGGSGAGAVRSAIPGV